MNALLLGDVLVELLLPAYAALVARDRSVPLLRNHLGKEIREDGLWHATPKTLLSHLKAHAAKYAASASACVRRTARFLLDKVCKLVHRSDDFAAPTWGDVDTVVDCIERIARALGRPLPGAFPVLKAIAELERAGRGACPPPSSRWSRCAACCASSRRCASCSAATWTA